LHCNVPPASAGVNVKLADVELVGFAGFVSIAGAAGATVSIVHVYVATAPTLPAASTWRTENVCEPSASGPA
jgi:hypothetical protein